MKKENKGFLVIDNISRKKARRLMKELKKSGRWLSHINMMKNDSAAGFAILTHGFPNLDTKGIEEFKLEKSKGLK